MHQTETRAMFQSDREITREELDEIQETVRLFPTLSRSELARTICEHLGWFTATGGYKTDACLKLLSRLEGTGFLNYVQVLEGSNQLATTWGARRPSFEWVTGIEYFYGPKEKKRQIVHLVVCEEHWQQFNPL